MGSDIGNQNPFMAALSAGPAAPVAPSAAPQTMGPAIGAPTIQPPAAAPTTSSGDGIWDYLPKGGNGLLGAIFGGLHNMHQNDSDNAFQETIKKHMATNGGAWAPALLSTLQEDPSLFHKVSPDTIKNSLALYQMQQKQTQIVQSGNDIGQVTTDPNGTAKLVDIGTIGGNKPLFQVSNNQLIYAPKNPDGSPMLNPDGTPKLSVTQIDPNANTGNIDLGDKIQTYKMVNGVPHVTGTFAKTPTPDAELSHGDRQAELANKQLKDMTPEDSYGIAALAAGAPPQGPLAALAYKYHIPLDPTKAGPAAQAILDQQKVQNPNGVQQPRNPVDTSLFANNVGNIRAPGGDGFRGAASLDDGIHMVLDNLRGYGKRGINTIQKIASTWAPDSDGNDSAAYAKSLASISRLPIDKPLNLQDPKTLTALALGIAQIEKGSPSVYTGGDAGAQAAAQTGSIAPDKPWAKTNIVGMNYDPEKDPIEKLGTAVTGPGAALAGAVNQVAGMFNRGTNSQTSPEIPYAKSRIETLKKILQPAFAVSKYFSQSELKTLNATLDPSGSFTGAGQWQTAIGALRDTLDQKLSQVQEDMKSNSTSKTEYAKLDAVKSSILMAQKTLGPDPRPSGGVPADFQLYTPEAAKAQSSPAAVAAQTAQPTVNPAVNDATGEPWRAGDTMVTKGASPYGPAGTMIAWTGKGKDPTNVLDPANWTKYTPNYTPVK